uniref:Putative ribosomal protein l1p/l10e family n=1 Tax=Ixodes ricinus TaxID=34613 RepID=A0A131Y7T7_IXORI
MAAHVDAKLVDSALKTLRNVERKHRKTAAKKLLVDDDASTEVVYLQFTLKKIPYNKETKRIRLELPHSLLSDTSEVCLITGDLEPKNKRAESEPTVDHFRELLTAAGVSRNIEVLPLRQLRTEYTAYEAKRQLCAGYDAFLADRTIYPVLPRLLGKVFFVKNKLPRRVDLKSKRLKHDIERALCVEELLLRGEGTASSVKVCHLGMSNKEATENVAAALATLECSLPGGWPNLLSVHLKTARSPALALHMSFGSRNEVHLPKAPEDPGTLEGDLSTVPGARVAVKRSGEVALRPATKAVRRSLRGQKGEEEPEELQHDSSLGHLLREQAAQRKEDTRRYRSKARTRRLLVHSALRHKGGRKRGTTQ